jgi:hypothetical protein
MIILEVNEEEEKSHQSSQNDTKSNFNKINFREDNLNYYSKLNSMSPQLEFRPDNIPDEEVN